MTSKGLEVVDTERTRRARLLEPLKERLSEHGKKWGDARAWALAEMAAGRRPDWRPADAPIQTANVMILTAYIEHLERN